MEPALKEWFDKTDWVRSTIKPHELGMHIADVLKQRIENLEQQIAKQEAALRLAQRITDYLAGGGLYNPELADHGAVRDLLIDCREALAEQPAQHQCSRSHPHENMDAMCELRTEIARLTNENARLKARHQDDEINAYRMTLLCIRDGLQQGMSKSIQKLQAREINDVLGLPSFASYRTSPQSKPWVGLDETDLAVCDTDGVRLARYWERVLREKNNGTR